MPFLTVVSIFGMILSSASMVMDSLSPCSIIKLPIPSRLTFSKSLISLVSETMLPEPCTVLTLIGM